MKLKLGALLERFDISTHQAGFYLEAPNEVRTGKGFTPSSKQPRTLNIVNPGMTFARLCRISARYGFTPHPGDLLALMEAA